MSSASTLSVEQSPPAMAGGLFSKSSKFSYFQPASMGHSINLHYTAQQSFQPAFKFLVGNGF